MPAKGVIAEGAVKIALTGYEAAKQQLLQLGGNAKAIGEKLSNVGKAASIGFAAASATMLSLVKAADPVRFTIFEQQLQILAILVGRLFIPILKKLIEVVNRVNVALAKMSPDQMASAAKWGKWGLAILAVVTAFTAVAKVVAFVVEGVSTLWGIVLPLIEGLGKLLKILGKFLPIGKIIAVLTLAFAALHGQGGRLAEIFAKIKGAALPVLEKMWGILKQLFSIFTEVAGLVGEIFDSILGAAGSGLLDVFEELIPLLTQGFQTIKNILDLVSSALKEVMDVIKDAKSIYKVLSEKKLKDVPKAVMQGVGRAAVNEGAGFLKKLNPFDSLDASIDSLANVIKDDVIGGREDEEKMLAERAKLDDDNREPVTGPGDYGGDDTNPFKPLLPAQKVETFGVEEAFKKAQQGATFDPSKAADMIQKLIAGGNTNLAEIVKNTTKINGAAMAY